MSSHLVATLIAVLVGGLIAGCGGSPPTETTAPTTAPPAETAAPPTETESSSKEKPAAGGGDTYEQCLQAAENVPDPGMRQQLETRCEAIPR